MTSISQDELMELWKSVNDDAYTEPFITAKANGQFSNIEIFEQVAAQLARASEMIDKSTQAMYIMPWSGQTNPPAAGGAYATVQISITLLAMSSNTVTFSTDLVFQEVEPDYGENGVVSIITGRQFKLINPIVFTPGNVGPLTGTVQATVQGYSYNLCAPGTICKILQPFTGDSPPYPTNSAVITNTNYPTNGVSPMLDMLGGERQIIRQPGESDNNYRLRVWRIADTITPNALIRVINNVLVQYGLVGEFREIGTPEFPGFFFDVPPINNNPALTFAYDIDPVTYPNFRFNVIVDYLTMRGFFLVGVPSSIPGDTSGNPLLKVVNGTIYAAIDAAKSAGVGFGMYQITTIGSTPF